MQTHLKDGGPVGEVTTPNAKVYRQPIGTADDAETKEPVYELSLGVGTYAPIIRNLDTGEWWSTSWRRLIALAEAEGLSGETSATLIWHPELG